MISWIALEHGASQLAAQGTGHLQISGALLPSGGDHPGAPLEQPSHRPQQLLPRCRPWDDNPQTVAPGAAKQPTPAASRNQHPAPGPAVAAPEQGGIGLHQLIERQRQQHQTATVQAQITGGLIHKPCCRARSTVLWRWATPTTRWPLAQIQPKDPQSAQTDHTDGLTSQKVGQRPCSCHQAHLQLGSASYDPATHSAGCRKPRPTTSSSSC